MFRAFIASLAFGLSAPIYAQTIPPEFCAQSPALGDGENLGAFARTTEATKCDTYLAESGRPAAVCYWQFPFRADAALAFFETMSDAVTGCFGTVRQTSTDKPVNHPDSYYLLELNADGLDMSVSLKDKTALGQSLVFLRVGRN